MTIDHKAAAEIARKHLDGHAYQDADKDTVFAAYLALQQEVDAIKEPLAIQRLHAEGGNMEILASHPIVMTLAAELTRMLKEQDAINYIELGFYDGAAKQAYSVLVQRKDGETPAAQNQRLRAELLALQQTVDAKEGNVARWAREHRAEIDQAYRDEFGLPDGMDRNLLHAALWEIVRRIENCGASPALTHAVVLASDLMGAVGNEFNKPRAYDLARVVEAVGPHNTWSAVCEKCQREWIAVYPAGTRTIACPGCGHCNDTPEAAVNAAAARLGHD